MWELLKKIYRFIVNVLLYSVVVILIIIGIAVLLYFVDQKQAAASGEKRSPLFGAFVIITNSMVPNININDAVITMRVDSAKINKGDVITFVSSDSHHAGTIITHRVVGINTTESGKIAYRTKGDHNNVEDATLVNYENVLGKVMVRIPYIGHIQGFLSTPYGWLLLIVLPCVLIIGSDIIKLFKNSSGDNNKNGKDNKEKKKEQIESTKKEDTPIETNKNVRTQEEHDEFEENILDGFLD